MFSHDLKDFVANAILLTRLLHRSHSELRQRLVRCGDYPTSSEDPDPVVVIHHQVEAFVERADPFGNSRPPKYFGLDELTSGPPDAPDVERFGQAPNSSLVFADETAAFVHQHTLPVKKVHVIVGRKELTDGA